MRELTMTENSVGFPPDRSNDIVGNVVFAEVRLPCKDLQADLLFFTKKLGFRLDMIFPADDPAVAVISGYGTHIRLERDATMAPGSLRLICNDPEAFAGGAPDLQAPTVLALRLWMPGFLCRHPSRSMLLSSIACGIMPRGEWVAPGCNTGT